MPRVSFAYRITADQVGLSHDPAFVAAPAAVRAEVLRRLVIVGLKEKDADLAHGLDKDGAPLIPVSPATRKHRRSAMGPADPDAPALMPAWALSRTRSLLDGRAVDKGGGYAEFFWRYDEHTGGSWGKILDHHRRGIGRSKVKRDVIGASAEMVARVRGQVLAWWAQFKARGFREAPKATPAAAPAPRVAVIGRTDYHAFTFGINGQGGAEASAAALARGRATGFVQKRTPGFSGFKGLPGEVKPLPPTPPPPPPPPPKPAPPPAPIPAPATTPPAGPARKGKATPAAAPELVTPILPGRPIAERIAGYAEGHEIGRKVEELYFQLGRDLDAAQTAFDAGVAELKRIGSLWLPADRDERKRLAAELATAEAAFNAAKAAMQSLRKDAAAKVLDLIEVAPERRARLKIGSTRGLTSEAAKGRDATLAGRVKDVAGRMARLFAAGRSAEHVEISSIAMIPAKKSQRDYHRGALGKTGRRESSVHLTPKTGDGVIAHEIGHAYEWQCQGIHDATRAFLEYRCAGEVPTRMAQKFPGYGYKAEEVGRKDHFDDAFDENSAYYIGKIYRHQNSEVISMGVQKLFEDPFGLATWDREYFVFLVGIIRGPLR